MLSHLMAALTGLQKALERECPHCHAKQSVPTRRREESVTCSKCGFLIPAR